MPMNSLELYPKTYHNHDSKTMKERTKRKRKEIDASEHENITGATATSPVRRALLGQYFTRVQSLRSRLLDQLPASSRLRRRKITQFGQKQNCSDLEIQLTDLLDNVLVCEADKGRVNDQVRRAQWQAYSAALRQDESVVTISGGQANSDFSQSEIVDFAIWLLFQREKQSQRPKHILCDGFRRSQREGDRPSTIAGVYNLYSNAQVIALKKSPWPEILKLLGQSGEQIMIDLLLDTSIFVPIQAGYQNYYQLSGVPLAEIDVPKKRRRTAQSTSRPPNDIPLVRSRIFYARPTTTAKGNIRPGFKHIHVLNRCQILQEKGVSAEPKASANSGEHSDNVSTIKVMMHMFPRQFGLHNVFTSDVDRTKTAQKFQDYTMREEEIAPKFVDSRNPKQTIPKIPKRLRGDAKRLVRRLMALHGRCSYLELLNYYCPVKLQCEKFHFASRQSTQTRSQSSSIIQQQIGVHSPAKLKGVRRPRRAAVKHASQHVQACDHSVIADLATPMSSVSAFCRATLSRIVPDELWGGPESGNKQTVLRKVDHFIRLRRYENLTLHEITQGLKITEIPWLQQPGPNVHKPCSSETAKRLEIFNEFLYYVFDSLLIPLLRSNFYVTESNSDRNHVFYFRHDVWKHLTEPAFMSLRANMLQELKQEDALAMLDHRQLGFSHIRLLPKGEKLRPIMNLRRRMMSTSKGKSKRLGQSINTILGPLHTMLRYEKDAHPSKLGSAMFSVNEIYTRLKSFKGKLGSSGLPLYFVKLDVQSAFDTIPQADVVELMASIPSQASYVISKHAEVKSGQQDTLASAPIRRWQSTAMTKNDRTTLVQRLESGLGVAKKHTVFVDTAARFSHDTSALHKLLSEHVQNNLVKVGKKFYRQKVGIPQGSVLSSFLCNYFYAALELEHLSFLQTDDCLLLRLIDDFLLISLDRSKAESFLEIMHGGVPEYGVQVNPAKTLVNFDVDGSQGPVRRMSSGDFFPYCGTLIDCRTLEIQKDRSSTLTTNLANSLTIEFGRSPGQSFQRKVLNAFKIQSHLMFFDSSHNTVATIKRSLHQAFRETACKMWCYVRCLPLGNQPGSDLIIRTIVKVVDVAYLLLAGKARKARFKTYAFDVGKGTLTRIAYVAFLEVLAKRQANFARVIAWLREQLHAMNR